MPWFLRCLSWRLESICRIYKIIKSHKTKNGSRIGWFKTSRLAHNSIILLLFMHYIFFSFSQHFLFKNKNISKHFITGQHSFIYLFNHSLFFGITVLLIITNQLFAVTNLFSIFIDNTGILSQITLIFWINFNILLEFHLNF